MSKAAPEWLDLKAPPRRVFERTPLILALCQVRYAPMLNVTNPIAVAPFQEAIIGDYPVLSQEQNVNVHVEGDLNRASVQHSSGSTSWRFTDTEDTWTVVLTTEFLTLETRSYSDFSEFLTRLKKVMTALAKSIRPSVGKRIGLRYVNEIRPGNSDGTSDWTSIIRPELLGALAIPQIAGFAKHSIQLIQLQGPSDIGVNIQHGSFPQGTVVTPRSDTEYLSDSFYLVDVDVYQEFKPGELYVKPKAICDFVEKYHEILSLLFRWSITEDYMATLGEV